jgi:hypothetical protein
MKRDHRKIYGGIANGDFLESLTQRHRGGEEILINTE